MPKLPDETLTAIGRMTVAATELEYLLAWIGADRAGGDAAAIFARPGEPLRAARGSVEAAAPGTGGVRRADGAGSGIDGLAHAVDGAATQLALSQAALRSLWGGGGRTDPAMFDEIAARLLRSREALQDQASRPTATASAARNL